MKTGYKRALSLSAVLAIVLLLIAIDVAGKLAIERFIDGSASLERGSSALPARPGKHKVLHPIERETRWNTLVIV